MKKINLIKMSLDILMAITFVLLFNKMVIAGLTFHEIAGLVIGVAFIIHKVINWKWIKQVTLNMFKKGIAIKTKIGYIVDVLLLFAMGYIIISGLLISKILFPNLRYGSEFFFKSTHMSVSYMTLILLGVHIGLHWHWAMNMFKNLFGITQKKKVLGYIAKILVILVFVFGAYSLYSTNFYSRVTMITTSFSQNQAPGGKNQTSGQENGFNRAHPDGNTQSGTGRPNGGNAPANVNVLNVLTSYLGVLAIFTIITYYIGNLISKRRLKVKAI